LLRSYEVILAGSAGKPTLYFPDLKPSISSVLTHVPRAAFYAALRPYIWESDIWIYRLAGLENMLVGLLMLGNLVRAVKIKSARMDWFILVLLFYCLVIAALLGLSTPNVGSLSRYKTAFQPVLVFLLLTGLRGWVFPGCPREKVPNRGAALNRLAPPVCSTGKDELPLAIN
jgi:peptidoglycan/LPS O-acetylase OafA/YrhL